MVELQQLRNYMMERIPMPPASTAEVSGEQPDRYEQRRERRLQRLRALESFEPSKSQEAAPPRPQTLRDLSFPAHREDKASINRKGASSLQPPPPTQGKTKPPKPNNEVKEIIVNFDIATDQLPEPAVNQHIRLPSGLVSCMSLFDTEARRSKSKKALTIKLMERNVVIEDPIRAPTRQREEHLPGALLNVFAAAILEMWKDTTLEEWFDRAIRETTRRSVSNIQQSEYVGRFSRFEHRTPAPSMQLTVAPPSPIHNTVFRTIQRLKAYHEKAMDSAPGGVVQDAYNQILRAKYYTTIGQTAWMHFPEDLRERYMTMIRRNLNLAECPQEARLPVHDHLKRLSNTPFANTQLTAEDEDVTDQYESNDVQQLLNNINSALVNLLVNSVVFSGDQPESEVLKAIRKLLGAKVGFYIKIEILSTALFSFPEAAFRTESDALAHFITAQRAYLCNPDKKEGDGPGIFRSVRNADTGARIGRSRPVSYALTPQAHDDRMFEVDAEYAQSLEARTPQGYVADEFEMDVADAERLSLNGGLPSYNQIIEDWDASTPLDSFAGDAYAPVSIQALDDATQAW